MGGSLSYMEATSTGWRGGNESMVRYESLSGTQSDLKK